MTIRIDRDPELPFIGWPLERQARLVAWARATWWAGQIAATRDRRTTGPRRDPADLLHANVLMMAERYAEHLGDHLRGMRDWTPADGPLPTRTLRWLDIWASLLAATIAY